MRKFSLEKNSDIRERKMSTSVWVSLKIENECLEVLIYSSKSDVQRGGPILLNNQMRLDQWIAPD